MKTESIMKNCAGLTAQISADLGIVQEAAEQACFTAIALKANDKKIDDLLNRFKL